MNSPELLATHFGHPGSSLSVLCICSFSQHTHTRTHTRTRTHRLQRQKEGQEEKATRHALAVSSGLVTSVSAAVTGGAGGTREGARGPAAHPGGPGPQTEREAGVSPRLPLRRPADATS